MSEKFTEFDKTGRGILTLVNTAMEITEIMFNVHFRQPRHDIARRFLNEISEFPPAVVQEQEARKRAAREVREKGPMPEDLYLKLTQSTYRLCEWGVPVGGAIEAGKAIMDNYWREKNADKSGG